MHKKTIQEQKQRNSAAALVRPNLEYALQFWAPSQQMDINRLEAFQARATKLVPTLRHFGYQQRMECVNLFKLQTQQL